MERLDGFAQFAHMLLYQSTPFTPQTLLKFPPWQVEGTISNKVKKIYIIFHTGLYLCLSVYKTIALNCIDIPAIQ